MKILFRDDEIKNLISLYLRVVKQHKSLYPELFNEIKQLYEEAEKRGLEYEVAKDWHYKVDEISREMKDVLLRYKQKFPKMYLLVFEKKK